MKRHFEKIILLALLIFLPLSCATKGAGQGSAAFGDWNDSESLRALIAYVDDVTDKRSANFIPESDRIAVFDMDGTLCGELFPEYLEYLLLEYRCLDDDGYEASPDLRDVAMMIRQSGKTYSTPAVSGFDLVHANAQARAFAGFSPDEFISYVKDFLKRDAKGFVGLKYSDSIYKPMAEVVNYLADNGFAVYVVSGSDRMLCRALVCDGLGIDESRVIGTDVNLIAANQGGKDGLDYQFNDAGDDRIVRGNRPLLKNLKMNKVQKIAQEIGKQPVLSFGNSSGDVSMHEYVTTSNKYKSLAFMLVADDSERDHANLAETAKRRREWEKRGYVIISMRDDFRTIYGDGVEKVD